MSRQKILYNKFFVVDICLFPFFEEPYCVICPYVIAKIFTKEKKPFCNMITLLYLFEMLDKNVKC